MKLNKQFTFTDKVRALKVKPSAPLKGSDLSLEFIKMAKYGYVKEANVLLNRKVKK